MPVMLSPHLLQTPKEGPHSRADGRGTPEPDPPSRPDLAYLRVSSPRALTPTLSIHAGRKDEVEQTIYTPSGLAELR